MPAPEPKSPLRHFHRWVNLSKPKEFDKPTTQEYTLVTIAVLFAPIILAFGFIYIFFQPEFLNLRTSRRVLFALAIPVLFPAAYCYVMFVDLLQPLVKRVLLRARMLRKAERAVQQLLHGLE